METKDTINYKNREFKNFSYVLAATYPPAAGMTGLDWRPFKTGETLNKIIGAHNDKSIKFYEDQGWIPEDVENEVTILKALIDTLSTVGKLRRSQVERIQFFLVDLDATQKETDALLTIRAQMSRRTNYILPVNSESTPDWLKQFFEKYPCLHQPLPDAATFQQLLDRFSRIEAIVVAELKQNAPSDGGDPTTEATKETYLNSLPDVTAEVRDAAMVERLTSEDVITSLASSAATQERVLSRITEQIRPEPDYHVNLNPVRQSIAGLAVAHVQEPDVHQVRLIKTTPTRPLSELAQEQRDTLADIGIKETNSVVVHHDVPGARDLIDSLGDAVETTSFSADLPHW